MMMTMTAVAFADDPATLTNGKVGTGGLASNVTAIAKSVNIHKTIKGYNPTAEKVNAPTITYTYSIAVGSAGKNIFQFIYLLIISQVGLWHLLSLHTIIKGGPLGPPAVSVLASI